MRSISSLTIQHFVHGEASGVAGLPTELATDGTVKSLGISSPSKSQPILSSLSGSTGNACFATLAQFTSQALGDDAVEGAADEERLDTHFDEPVRGRGGVVGVQGGQHQVAGQGGLDGDRWPSHGP